MKMALDGEAISELSEANAAFDFRGKKKGVWMILA